MSPYFDLWKIDGRARVGGDDSATAFVNRSALGPVRFPGDYDADPEPAQATRGRRPNGQKPRVFGRALSDALTLDPNARPAEGTDDPARSGRNATPASVAVTPRAGGTVML